MQVEVLTLLKEATKKFVATLDQVLNSATSLICLRMFSNKFGFERLVAKMKIPQLKIGIGSIETEFIGGKWFRWQKVYFPGWDWQHTVRILGHHSPNWRCPSARADKA